MRLYDHLFSKPDPDDVPEGQDYLANLNPNSLVVLNGCKLEPSLASRGDRRPIPVRAARLFLRGQGLQSRITGLQSRGDAARYLGEDAKEEVGEHGQDHRRTSTKPRIDRQNGPRPGLGPHAPRFQGRLQLHRTQRRLVPGQRADRRRAATAELRERDQAPARPAPASPSKAK